jgi:hypothetical protein
VHTTSSAYEVVRLIGRLLQLSRRTKQNQQPLSTDDDDAEFAVNLRANFFEDQDDVSQKEEWSRVVETVLSFANPDVTKRPGIGSFERVCSLPFWSFEYKSTSYVTLWLN